MLNGWNRKVRMTSAIRRAWMTTRMVSPKPLSDLVPVVALIAFPIPAGPDAHAVAERSLHAKRSTLRVRKMALILILRANSGLNLESASRSIPCGVLDGCSQGRNQAPPQNFAIH